MSVDGAATHPRVSRETRRLLTAAALAMLSLWALARVRFPDSPPAPTPVAPLLSQFVPRNSFADLATQLRDATPAIEARLQAVAATSSGGTDVLTGLRIGPALVAVAAPESTALDALGYDRPSGLYILRADATRAAVSADDSAVETDWPRRPGFLIAASARSSGVEVRPVYVASLQPARDPAWDGPIALLPREAQLQPGTALFTIDGSPVGLVAGLEDSTALAPVRTLQMQAERIQKPKPEGATLGVEVRRTPPGIAGEGLIVAWVQQQGPAADRLFPGDRMLAVNDGVVSSLRDWAVIERDLTPGTAVRLGIIRNDVRQDITVTAAPPLSPPAADLGVALRSVAMGALVTGVAAGSAGAGGGIAAGDVIYLVNGTFRPGPAAIRQAFMATRPGEGMLVGVTRGGQRRLITVWK